MVTGPAAGCAVHEDCGQLVLMVDGEPFELGGAEHLCTDYAVWHQPPDRRHPSDLDVPGGWRPARVRQFRAA